MTTFSEWWSAHYEGEENDDTIRAVAHHAWLASQIVEMDKTNQLLREQAEKFFQP